MKPFTPHKKWVMTATLLAVLGFNVSFNNHEDGVASADFASKSDVVKTNIATAEGVLPVKYIKDGENQVLALVPQRDAEGKICGTCEYAPPYKINTKNIDDIDSLNVELLRQLNNSSKTAAAEVSRLPRVDGEEGERIIADNPFEKISAACEKREQKSEKLQCFSERFLRAINAKSAKDISPEQATSFFRKEIEGLIKSEMADARRIEVKQYRASLGNSGLLSMDMDSDDVADPESMRADTLEIIQNLHAGVPTRFENIRKRLMKTEEEIVAREVLSIKQTVASADANKNTYQGMALLSEANVRHSALRSLISNMTSAHDAGLESAVSDKDLSSSVVDQYQNYWNTNTNVVQQSMAKFLNDYSMTGKMPNEGLNTTLPDANLDARIGGAARNGAVVADPNAAALSSRTGSTVVGTVARTATGDLVVIPQGQSTATTNNTGVVFGTVVPLTQENTQMRDAIRLQYGYQQ